MSTRFTNGGATITLDAGLEAFMRSLLSSAETEAVAIMERELGVQRDLAAREWYGPNGVTKRTGLSGQIEVVTTFDAGKNTVRVALGSTDSRRAGKANKPLVVYVHRPRNLALEAKVVSQEAYWHWKRGKKPALPPPVASSKTNEDRVKRGLPIRVISPKEVQQRKDYGITGNEWAILVPSDKAADGKFLLTEYIRKPAKAIVKRILPELGRAIALRAQRGGR